MPDPFDGAWSRAVSALLCGVLFLAVGCRSPKQDAPSHAPGKVVVHYWRHYNKQETRAVKALIASFEKQNPGVSIKLRTFPFGVYKTKLVASLAAGTGPDLTNIHNSWAYGYMRAGLIVALPKGLFGPDELDRAFFPLTRSFRYNEAYYGVPIGGANLGLYYNRTLFKKGGLDPSRPPRNWTELLAQAKRLTRRDENGRMIQAGASLGRGSGQGWNYFVEGVLRQGGAQILAADKRSVRWNSSAGRQALTWFTDFIKKHRVNSVMFPSAVDAFRLGLSAMVVDGSWRISRLADVAPNLDYGTAVVPLSKKYGTRATYGTCWGNAVTRRASGRVQRAAWRFIRFASSYERMKRWSTQTGEIPMRRKILGDKAWLARTGRLAPFVRQMAYARASLKKDEGEYQRAIVDAIDEVLLHDEAPKAALAKAARRVDRMLGSR